MSNATNDNFYLQSQGDKKIISTQELYKKRFDAVDFGEPKNEYQSILLKKVIANVSQVKRQGIAF